MNGFFKKFADAFVEVEEDTATLGANASLSSTHTGSKIAGAEDLDAITADASELLSQLNGSSPTEASGIPQKSPATATQTVTAGDTSDLAMRMHPEQIFETAGILDGTNSAHRILKLIAGLSSFPREQQVVMIKAMDAADDSWAEEDVLQDARARQSALRNHLKLIDAERDEFLSLLDAKITEKKTTSENRLSDIDAQIAELQAQRQAAIVDMTSQVEKLEHQKEELVEDSKKARHGLTEVINALSDLISFFNSTNAS